MNLLVFTSFLFLIPFLFAVYRQLYHYASAYLFVAITSILYHGTAETHFCMIDMIAAYSVIFVNMLFIYNYWNCKQYKCIYSMLFAVLGFVLYGYINYINRDYYYYLHSLWHILVAFGSTILYA